jgi:lipoprotein-releasing system ATP-binding protein
MTTLPLIEARALTKDFALGNRVIPVLRGVDLAVAPREMVALLGSSGAGKSTLLHILGLLDPPTSGEVRYDGAPVHRLPIRRRAELRHSHVGFVFQFYHLIPELTALQNVELGTMMDCGLFAWLAKRRSVSARAHQLLELVGLSERTGNRPAELSGGERQRVAIARALIAEPRVIFADEPTGNLDSATAEGILQLLFDINRERGIAFLLVTHNEELARRCDRIVRLKDGVIVS